MNLRVLAIPLSFAAAAAALFIVLNILGTPDPAKLTEAGGIVTGGQEAAEQIASLDNAPGSTPQGSENGSDPGPTAPAAEGTQTPGGGREQDQSAPAPDAQADRTDAAIEPGDGTSENTDGAPPAAVDTSGTQDNPDEGATPAVNIPAVNTPATNTQGEPAETHTAPGEGSLSDPQSVDIQSPGPENTDITPAETATAEAVPMQEDPATTPLTEPQTPEPQPIEDRPIVDEPIELVALAPNEQARFGRTMVDADGTLSILQGEGVAGSVLEILVDDQILINTNVNPSGNWSLYQDSALPLGLNTLTLRSRLGDGRVGLSDQQLVAFLPDDGGAVKGALIDGGLVTVLNAPRFVTKLTIEGLIYGPDGAVLFGKAPAGAEVRFSGGDDPSALIGSSGVWALDLGTSTTGVLIQRSPVTGQDVASMPVSVPAQPFIDAGETLGLAGGVALGLEDRAILLF